MKLILFFSLALGACAGSNGLPPPKPTSPQTVLYPPGVDQTPVDPSTSSRHRVYDCGPSITMNSDEHRKFCAGKPGGNTKSIRGLPTEAEREHEESEERK